MPNTTPEYSESMRASMGSESTSSTLQNGNTSDEDQSAEREDFDSQYQDDQEDDPDASGPPNTGYDDLNPNPTPMDHAATNWDKNPEPWSQFRVRDTDRDAGPSDRETLRSMEDNGHEDMGRSPEEAKVDSEENTSQSMEGNGHEDMGTVTNTTDEMAMGGSTTDPEEDKRDDYGEKGIKSNE